MKSINQLKLRKTALFWTVLLNVASFAPSALAQSTAAVPRTPVCNLSSPLRTLSAAANAVGEDDADLNSTEVPRMARPNSYPPDAGVIDVVRDCGVDPTGQTDTTARLKRILKEYNGTTNTLYPANPRTLFFRRGTYLISDTIFAESAFYPGTATSTVRLLGESRETTIIKLKDNAPGYDQESQPKFVVQTGNYGTPPTPVPYTTHSSVSSTPAPQPTAQSTPQPNSGFGNYIESLTIDTGVNNPGAVALRYDVANMGALQDVSIRSGDGKGK